VDLNGRYAHLDHPTATDNFGWGQGPDWKTEFLYCAQ